MTPITYIEIGLFAALAVWEAINDYRINHPEKNKRLVTLVPYAVQKGDTLYSLARKFNTCIDDLKKWNSDKLNAKRVEIMREKKGSFNTYDKALYYVANEIYEGKNDDYWMQLLEGEVIYVPVWEEE